MNSILTNSSPIYGDEVLKIFVSVLCGSILGFEREIRGKSAGFRTLALICFGSTIFTICSYVLGVDANRDRVAANIITGVGFLGAGVIFRNNISVSGITTAASIWISAAIGMLVGIGAYELAGISMVLALFILYAMDYIQFWIDYRFQHRDYKVVLNLVESSLFLTGQLGNLKLKCTNIKVLRSGGQLTWYAQISGRGDRLEVFNNWLLNQEAVSSFEW
ncbi:MgtC/SapB family protein [Pedobacter sp. PLR]|uniref:MgtC/SapB family protein n=1 Tax=Pedobacter sp. PLR TaxID=2994465 RepID=UPI002245B319|nr:MgtC/SapB family protein [Pedobacter sp. PLR]MCX2454021.1 MgtC/SapB family protein [Pedobacter sp. PLR]